MTQHHRELHNLVSGFLSGRCEAAMVDELAGYLTDKLVAINATPAPRDLTNNAYRDGTVIARFKGGAAAVEGLVREANRHTEHTMDWHIERDYAVVMTRGDTAKARLALKNARPLMLHEH